MKTKKLVLLALVAALLSSLLISCGQTTPIINVTLIITAGEEEVFHDTIEIQHKEPTLMMLVQEAAMLNGLNIVYNEAGDSVLDIGEYKSYKDEETGIDYFWEYLINGVMPDNATGGKANAQPIADGDVIEYIYSTFDPATIKK